MTPIEQLLAQITTMKQFETNRIDFFGANPKSLKTLEAFEEIVRVAVEGLEWVVHPKHDEPDDYTRLGCAQFRAHEALKKINSLAHKCLEGK